LSASACIPFIFDNTIRTVNNIKYIDGGLTNNQPILNNSTLKISCLNHPLTNAHIYPLHLSCVKYSFRSPSPRYIVALYNQGYYDINKYMHNNLYK
jgi:hypothetical protein